MNGGLTSSKVQVSKYQGRSQGPGLKRQEQVASGAMMVSLELLFLKLPWYFSLAPWSFPATRHV
jgi:hypothetical protein